jgi:hypothetical protein
MPHVTGSSGIVTFLDSGFRYMSSYDFSLSSGIGFGKPQRTQRTQRKITTLCALRVLCG